MEYGSSSKSSSNDGRFLANSSSNKENCMHNGGGYVHSSISLLPEPEQQNTSTDDKIETEDNNLDNNNDGLCGDEPDATNDNPQKKRKSHRHTPNQIQQLEAVFKECPHPDQKQQRELSKRVSMDITQVKFWFQNRRTHYKSQAERYENKVLRQEIDRLRAVNMAMTKIRTCVKCGGHAENGETSTEKEHLRSENTRLKNELDRIWALAGNALDLGPDFRSGVASALSVILQSRSKNSIADTSVEKSKYVDLALASMEELVTMAKRKEPLWRRSAKAGRQVLNKEEYMRSVNRSCLGLKPNGFASDVSKETGMVNINALALLDILMDSNHWEEMFPCLIGRCSTREIICRGMGGTKDGALQLMDAELQVVSPAVRVRQVTFLRFCKKYPEGFWAVVDVSFDDTTPETTTGTPPLSSYRRLPSGCVVQDMPNGFSKVTWVEHAEYDESEVRHLYRRVVSSGIGFGAQRWLTTLQRQCQSLSSITVTPTLPSTDRITPGLVITSRGRHNMMNLARRMIDNYCSGVCASTVHKWNTLNVGNVDENIPRIMARKSVPDQGEPAGLVLCAATSIRLPVSPFQLFDFITDQQHRDRWDILIGGGGPVHEMANLAKGQHRANSVSLLSPNVDNSKHGTMLVLQETCLDVAESYLVYAPVEIPPIYDVMEGGDSAYVPVLPSGFTIVPDGPCTGISCASLLTVSFQISASSVPNFNLLLKSVETINNLVLLTVRNIRRAIECRLVTVECDEA